MSLVKKLKDILFEEEEVTEPIKVTNEVKREEKPKIIKIEPDVDKKEVEVEKEVSKVSSEREIFKSSKEVDNSFTFPDFDEEEFKSNMNRSMRRTNTSNNVLDYERKKSYEKRTDNHSNRLDRVENKDYSDKKKFKPSPIISPVYGILNQDYKAEDIVNKKDVASNIDIEEVRRKAFEPKEEKVKEEDLEPVVTFFDEKVKDKKDDKKEKDYKTIDDLLNEASEEIELDDTLEIPELDNNLEEIEEELKNVDVSKEEEKDLDDTLDNDLFELIDSMYDEREETD